MWDLGVRETRWKGARKQRKWPGVLKCVEAGGREMGDKCHSSIFCQGLHRYQIVHAFVLLLDVLLLNTGLWQARGQAQGYALSLASGSSWLIPGKAE